VAGLYIHLPFCRNKCSYCGFYSETDSYSLQQEYLDAVITDLTTRNVRNYDTLYIGGGTPSTTDPYLLSKFLDKLNAAYKGGFKESTIEANPESVSDSFLALVRDYGFTRLSLGCQSTSDDVLKKLTRIHSSKDIFDSVDKIRKICPDTALNMDMIYDIPETDWETTHKTIKDFLSVSPEHISAYIYSFDTDYLKDKDKDSTDYMLVRETLTDAGYGKYEISNFAKPGFESLHNINYWQLGDYDGLGASAWSLWNLPGKRVLKGKSDDLHDYIADPSAYKAEEISEPPLTAVEEIVFGLRIAKGVNFEKIFTNVDAEIREKMYNTVMALVEKGFLVWEHEMVSLSPSGELLLDSVQELLWRQYP